MLNRISTTAFAMVLLAGCGIQDGELLQKVSPTTSGTQVDGAETTQLIHEDAQDERRFLSLLANDTGTCDEGVTAFKNSVHKLIRERCVKCHDSQDEKGPRFAVDDVSASYGSVLAYQNFDSIATSIFVKKGGNMHCLNTYNFDCKTDEAAISGAVQAWWDNGEKNCPRKGKFFTPQLTVPTNLPDRATGFTRLRWDLTSIGPLFRNSQFEMEAQMFAPASADSPAAYRFRKPRILTPTRAISLKDVKILTNGRFNPLEDTFRSIDQTVNPGTIPAEASAPAPFPVLSSKTQIVIAGGSSDQLMVSFEELKTVATPVQCRYVTEFTQNVMPLLGFRDCHQCHAGGAEAKAGTEPARSIFSMDKAAAELCKSFLQRIDRRSFQKSPIVTYPTQSAHGHPRAIISMDEATRGMKEWFDKEMSPVTQVSE